MKKNIKRNKNIFVPIWHKGQWFLEISTGRAAQPCQLIDHIYNNLKK
jgi:hypothetical protein